MDSKEKDYPLTLKVMRLTRPSLFTGIGIWSDIRDLPGDLFNAAMREDIALPSSHPSVGIGQLLLLPQSFGNLYLGETFSCCICVHNSSQDIYQISLKVMLQMGSQRVTLLGDGDDDHQHELDVNKTLSEIIQYEVKDIGSHILVCAANYKGPSGDSQSFRKFFKFEVTKPLDVKTKFYNTESDEVYLEAGVQNITSGPICLEKVELEPSSYFAVTPFENFEVDNISIFGQINVLNSHDTRQYLYCLKPKAEAKTEPLSLQQSSIIGKLDIVWRTNMGDRGRLQTSQLYRQIPQYGDVQVTVEEVPSTVIQEETFNITLCITNICEKNLDLQLDFLDGKGTLWCNVTSRILPTIAPSSFTKLTFTLLPILTGLQAVAGVKLTDTFLKRTYEYENLAQVFVRNEMPSQKGKIFADWVGDFIKMNIDV